MSPKIENTPGIVWRERKDGWTAFWQARTDLVKRGYRPKMISLFSGIEPSPADIAMMQDICQQQQAEMLVWGRGGVPEAVAYDGSMRSLAECYRTDPDSSFRKNRYQTRKHYESLLRRIVDDHGDVMVSELRGRDMLRWHKGWSAGGKIPMAHSLMGMVRGLFGFGMTLLECTECTRMCAVLSKQRFQMGKSRGVQLTAEMASMIRARAHQQGLHSIALAQALQFECAFRQKDCIGEWVPLAEPGTSDVIDAGKKWLRGVTWGEIDGNLILRHVTSKRQKLVEIDLNNAGMVMDEFARLRITLLGNLPTTGPIIIRDGTNLPWTSHAFRAEWRKIARAVGVPDAVRNMDTRSGAITEATDSGASLEDTRHMATHSDISMTAKYSRDSAGKTAKVMQMRAAHRQNKSGT
jgi:hypothetical protein